MISLRTRIASLLVYSGKKHFGENFPGKRRETKKNWTEEIIKKINITNKIIPYSLFIYNYINNNIL